MHAGQHQRLETDLLCFDVSFEVIFFLLIVLWVLLTYIKEVTLLTHMAQKSSIGWGNGSMDKELPRQV